MHDGCYGIEEGQSRITGQILDGSGQSRRSQWPGGDDDIVPIFGRKPHNLIAHDGDEGMLRQRLGDGRREAFAVDRKRPARRHFVLIAHAHDERSGAAHFLMQEADGVACRIVRAEGIGADELRQAFALMCIGHAPGAHFMEDDGNAGLRCLPGSLAAGQAAADDMDGLHGHGRGPITSGGFLQYSLI